jgi:hypothetical protein
MYIFGGKGQELQQYNPKWLSMRHLCTSCTEATSGLSPTCQRGAFHSANNYHQKLAIEREIVNKWRNASVPRHHLVLTVAEMEGIRKSRG